MKENIMPLLYGVIGILVLALVINVAIGIYEPTAVSNAVKSTVGQNFTVDGVTYLLTGNGQSAQVQAQEVHDSINTIRITANVLFGLVFLILVILGVVELLGKKKHG
jgi:hypothetical protein